jgi:predicted tellurium resistance membrane protein TerC
MNMDQIISLITLLFIEIILGIDNVIFISILANKLPEERRKVFTNWGLSLAMVMRLLLLLVISWLVKLDDTLFTMLSIDISGKDLILIIGGLFLIYKSAKELFFDNDHEHNVSSTKNTFNALLGQVILLDLVFSVDSIITAIGLVSEVWIMYAAVIVSTLVMFFAARPIHNFIQKYPSFKILALCFLLLVGVSLIAEGISYEIPKGYIYFSMGFAFLVDWIQMKKQKN